VHPRQRRQPVLGRPPKHHRSRHRSPFRRSSSPVLRHRPVTGSRTPGVTTGEQDKAKNTGENVTGKIKETTGKATGNESLEAEGKVDQVKADTKQAGEKVKDAFS